MQDLNLVLGDQLFADISVLPPAQILMVEDFELASRHRYHSHKLVLTFAAMRHFAMAHGDRVEYRRLDAGCSIFSELKAFRDTGGERVHCFEPADRSFGLQLLQITKELEIEIKFYENPMFVTSRSDWEQYRTSHRRLLQADFYKEQRLRLDLLIVDENQPIGGQWSYDEQNRKKLPRSYCPPYVNFPVPNQLTEKVIREVNSVFPEAIGSPYNFRNPVTWDQANDWLDDFLENRVDLFGDYEDALSQDEWIVHHSLLTPMLNIGLLTPNQVLEKLFVRHHDRPIPINSLEGFVRQLVGWREFVRGVHRENMWPELSSSGRRLSKSWYEGSTGLPPLDLAINRAVEFGWCHHIERLMVMGSVMFMCEVRPKEVFDYFMSLFVDASEWVMEGNVYGMSQYVEPRFATKPYISASAYILKMSDFAKGEWCETWDGLYWRTIYRMKESLASNHRMSMMLNQLERMDSGKKKRIFDLADQFIERNTFS